MALFGGTPAANTANNSQGDISKDVQLSSPPEDGITGLSFSPQADYLSVTSWDKKVRIYEIQASGQSEGKAMYEHEGPVFASHWSPVSQEPV
jgi:mRNA export factor